MSIYKAVPSGSGLLDKAKLIFYITAIKALAHFKRRAPFSVRVAANGRSAAMGFSGTVDEMLALGHIFMDEEYKPSIDPRSIADLGANIGIASAWFALRYPEAHITAYEANAEVVPLLKKNVEPLGVRVEQKAVGATNGPVTFHVSPRSFSSSLEPKAGTVPAVVQGIALSDIDADFLKMDIEGAEFAVAGQARAEEIVGELHGKSPRDIDEISSKLAGYDCTFTAPKGLFRAVRKDVIHRQQHEAYGKFP